jgi:hypothetical protein
MAPIRRGLWERITTAGAPRVWSTIWLMLSLYGVLLSFFAQHLRWLPVVGLVWMLGQGGLIALTCWDEHFDDVALAHLTRRYKKYYEV